MTISKCLSLSPTAVAAERGHSGTAIACRKCISQHNELHTWSEAVLLGTDRIHFTLETSHTQSWMLALVPINPRLYKLREAQNLLSGTQVEVGKARKENGKLQLCLLNGNIYRRVQWFTDFVTSEWPLPPPRFSAELSFTIQSTITHWKERGQGMVLK